MKPQICIALDIEDHDLPQPGDVEIGQNIICPDGPRMVWSDISKADWPMPMNAAPKTLPKIDPTPPTTTVMNALTM